MDENQIQSEVQERLVRELEPANSDNSIPEQVNSNEDAVQNQKEQGQSLEDPSQNLILGKFKSVEELAKAYEELQRHQGLCSEELGALRKDVSSYNDLQKTFQKLQELQSGLMGNVKRDQEKYNAPEYFQDPTFREMYKEAFVALGDKLDTDRFVNLLNAYVSSRIFANEKQKAAQSETQKVLDSMTYEKNPKSSLTPPKKRFDEMTEKEIDELLDKLI